MSSQFAQTLSIQRQLVAPRMKGSEPVRAGRARPTRLRRRLRGMFPPLLLFVTLLIQISVRVTLIERGYELEHLRSEALKKDTALRQLKLDLALITRPADMSRAAEERAGLRPVDPQKVRAVLEAE